MVVKRDSMEPIDFQGLRILDYTANLDGRSSFAVITVPPGSAHGEAWSKRSDKYYYMVTGEVEFTLDGQCQVLSAGDFCIVPKGQRFSYVNSGSAAAELVLVHTPCFDLNSEVFVDTPGE